MISEVIKAKYHRVTFDTKFKLASNRKHEINNTHPRFASPMGPNKIYCVIKASTDKGSIRQLGLTLSADDDSMLVWEFNFESFYCTKNKKKKKRNDHINSYSFFSFSPSLLWSLKQPDDNVDYVPWCI